MIGEADIWRSAAQIIKRYGEDAPLEAAMRADAMLEAGDLDGLPVWKRIKSGRNGRFIRVVTHQSLRSDGRMPGLTTAMVRFAGITVIRPRLCS